MIAKQRSSAINSGRDPGSSGYLVEFEPSGKRVSSLPGETLLDCARRSGVRVSNICGGRGLCKSCVVRVVSGPVPEPSDQDKEFFSATEIEENWRRACQTFLVGDCRIEVSSRAQAVSMRTQIESEDVWVQPDPVVRSLRTIVSKPKLEEPVADDNRLRDALNARWPSAAHHIDIDVLRGLPDLLRATDGRVTALSRFGEIVAVVPSQKGPLLGLAVDVGTTNIGALLVDLRTGRTLASQGLENPQVVRGGDVITRMAYARRSPDALEEMRMLLVGGINEVAQMLCEKRGASPDQIGDIVIAGNTAMHHLLIGLPVDYLGAVPFIPAVSAATDFKARDLNLTTMPGAYVHLLPNIAGYVGGDHTAVLLTIGSDRESRTLLMLDIGTNTEISLLHEGRLSSLSCPSGPALEGGHIRNGMLSGPGAIESMRIDGDSVQLRTIGDVPPVGICGSGVVDITAQLFLSGVINATGKMTDTHPRVRLHNGKPEFVVADESETGAAAVVFTQGDVRAVQLAKGAIQSGFSMLLEEAGLTEDRLDQVIIAGAFGSYIDIDSAVAIGLLPAVSPERYAQVGNAAMIGAKLALVSHGHRTEAETIASTSHYLELSGSARFNKIFMNSMGFHRAGKQSNEEEMTEHGN